MYNSIFVAPANEQTIIVIGTYKTRLSNFTKGDKITLTETVKCPYCDEVFEGETQIEAKTQEGIHRAENHVNEGESTSKAKKGRNIIDEWKTEGRKA